MNHIISTVTEQYSSWIVRWYARIRFLIININMLDLLLRYVPRTGILVSPGCGFGLFECAFCMANPQLEIVGYDLNPRRIEQARRVARKLNLRSVRFECANVVQESVRADCACILTLELLHHIS